MITLLDMYHHLQSIASSLFRLAAVVFLRIIPSSLGKAVLPGLYLFHLLALYLFPLPQPAHKKKHWQQPAPSAPLTVLAFSLATHSRILNAANLLVNSLLLLAAADLAFSPLVHPAHDLSFSRVGAVYPDAAKIVVRAPFQYDFLHILYRDTTSPDLPWIDGPPLILLPQNDWVHTVRLDNLWPSTPYECQSLFLFSPTFLTFPRCRRHLQQVHSSRSLSPHPLPHLPRPSYQLKLPVPLHRFLLYHSKLSLQWPSKHSHHIWL